MPSEPDAPPSCPNCGRQMRVVEECLHCAMSSALEAVKQAPEPMECGDAEDGFASFAEPKLPARLGRFVLHSRLGHGGMGTVYEAEDVELQRVVALKMIRSQRFAGLAERQRFKREALATAKLDHPHIVPVYEAGELDECPFLAMKLIRGNTLADLVRHGPMPAEKAVRIMAKVAAALQHAHDCGVLHRDLKPSNILIDEQGEPWLTDFGLARLQTGGAHETLHGAQIGTPMYMAPEQAEGRSGEVGPATDVWALGLLLFQMLSGKTPYEMSDNLAVIQQVITKPPPRYLAPTLDQRGLAALIERCLQKDPAQRLASAGLLADELQRWGRGEALLTYPVTPLERGLRGLRRHPAVAAALGIALAALVGWWLLPPAADYVITTREGVVTITSRGAENEVLELIASSENGTLRALAEGRRFRVDGVTQAGGAVELPLAGVREWVIETGRAKDRVMFRGKLLLEKDASLELRPETVSGGYCNVYIDQRAELRASGTGSISIAASAGIEMDTGAVLEVENGPLHLAGNWPSVPAKTSFHGVLIKGANVQSVGTGAVTLQGHGGSKSANMGVGILGGRVSGGKPGATLRV
ncbi:MAG: serine/threonine-protein kinase, partial [Verrucomicrobia bacterium]|nr:serine/threonine-protein kinase [Verrucomicrobiota bacterium]